jgi:hypothetical protein
MALFEYDASSVLRPIGAHGESLNGALQRRDDPRYRAEQVRSRPREEDFATELTVVTGHSDVDAPPARPAAQRPPTSRTRKKLKAEKRAPGLAKRPPRWLNRRLTRSSPTVQGDVSSSNDGRTDEAARERTASRSPS